MEKANEKKDFLQKTWVVCALALVCTFLWGSASPCIKLGYALFKIPSSETWTQVLFAGTRFVLAGVLTILIGSILNRKMLLPTKSSVPSIVKLAMFQTILQYIFFYIGLAHNSGVKASIINGSNTFSYLNNFSIISVHNPCVLSVLEQCHYIFKQYNNHKYDKKYHTYEINNSLMLSLNRLAS